jgi:hypothetical protein
VFKKRILISSLFIVSIAQANMVSAASVANGTFNSDLSGWSTLDGTNDPFANGSVGWLLDGADGKAALSTGLGTSALSAAIDQGLSSGPITLGPNDVAFKFSALFAREGAEVEDASSFVDSLNVVMYDMNSLFSLTFVNIDYLTSATLFSFDVSAYSGLTVEFSFELSDEGDGFNSSVSLDNISLEQRSTDPGTVPEPDTLWLMGLGALGLAGSSLRKKSFNFS